MHSSTLLLTLAAALSATAYPASDVIGRTGLSKRACTTVYPHLRVAPTLALPYDIAINGTKGVEIGFTIPESAVGSCNLMVRLPQGGGISGSAQINVVALDGPAPGSLVATTDFGPGVAATINSFACRPQMCYSFRVASGQEVLHFTESEGSGLYMTFGC